MCLPKNKNVEKSKKGKNCLDLDIEYLYIYINIWDICMPIYQAKLFVYMALRVYMWHEAAYIGQQFLVFKFSSFKFKYKNLFLLFVWITVLIHYTLLSRNKLCRRRKWKIAFIFSFNSFYFFFLKYSWCQ